MGEWCITVRSACLAVCSVNRLSTIWVLNCDDVAFSLAQLMVQVM